MEYKGQERRKGSQMSQEERDLLIRIDENLKNLIQIFEDHTKSDSSIFMKQANAIENLNKIVFIGIGGIGVLQIVLKLFLK
jgi:hypothetical protein